MSTTVNGGWLKDNNGDKFAPKTLTSQVINGDGETLSQVLNEVVLFTEQALTDEQKAQARDNIEAINSWNELTDKPFGETTEQVVIYENEKISGGPAIYGEDLLTVSAFVPGDTYIVTVDDVDYTGIAEWWADSTSDGGNGIRLFSNGLDDFSDAPVNITSYSNCIYIDFEVNGTHSVKITHLKTTTVPLDEKFIPDTIARVEDLNSKQDKLTGTQGQIVGFDENGEPIAQDHIPNLSSIILKSSTEDSSKEFRITIDDSGTLTVTEIV